MPAEPPQQQHFDLAALALNNLHKLGFVPEFSAAAQAQLQGILGAANDGALPDLPAGTPAPGSDERQLPWSSIDNDTSRDLDQIEQAERVAGGIRVRVAIADVATTIPKDSPLDQHAAAQTRTVYTAVRNFPMLPVELSTGLTSLNPDSDRAAIVLSFTVDAGGNLLEETVASTLVRNRAQLTYSAVGPWLERQSGHGAGSSSPTQPQPFAPEPWLAEQLQLQDEASQALRAARTRDGALDFHRAEADPVMLDGHIAGLAETVDNRAMHLIEDLMVAANGVMARALRRGGRSGLQRVVRVPQRWDRIAALAAERGTKLPDPPDPAALNSFLVQQRGDDPVHYEDLALSVLKLMGAGEYVLVRPDEDPAGHFGLAARDYAHSTAPNRRFPDLVTQRILHAMLENAPPPYSDDELNAIATHCNEADRLLRKVDRAMQKRVAAMAMSEHIGEVFHGVITGVSSKGVYVRVMQPPFEGRIVRNEAGLDVGMQVDVQLLHTDPVQAFIDFANVSAPGPAKALPSPANARHMAAAPPTART